MSEPRTAGYCVGCDRLVVRTESGACPEGHPAEAVSGFIMLADTQEIPRLARFNLAAFLLPFIWGPAHGQWAGMIFLPLWLFTDSIIRSAAASPAGIAGSAFAVAGTLIVSAWFGKRANGLGWRRVADRVSVHDFMRVQRLWAIVAVPVAVALVAGAAYYDIAIAPTRGM